jgi:hypothetical protein
MNNLRFCLSVASLCAVLFCAGCGIYSFTGTSTAARTMQVADIFNNTDLGPANLGPNFTNKLKDYFQRNSSLKVVPEGGELQVEGTIVAYAIAPMAPVAPIAGAARPVDDAALSRLTITVKLNYVDNLDPKNNFKDKTFSFFADFNNNLDFTRIQEDLERRIFDQILIDIFNATVANW